MLQLCQVYDFEQLLEMGLGQHSDYLPLLQWIAFITHSHTHTKSGVETFYYSKKLNYLIEYHLIGINLEGLPQIQSLSSLAM